MRKIKHLIGVIGVVVITAIFLALVSACTAAAPASEPESPSSTEATPEAGEDKPSETIDMPEEETCTAPAPETLAAPETAPEMPVETQPEEPEKEYIYFDVPLDDDIQEYAQDLCKAYNFPFYNIVVAIIGHESSYRERVISDTDDYGYMQINSINHDWLREALGVTDFLDGRQNILCGIYIIQDLYHKYGDIGLALMAYNRGEAGAAKLWNKGIYSVRYSEEIQAEAERLTERSD